jgi:uncharacterized protein YuzE
MSISFRGVVFDEVDFDRDGDVLYLSVAGVEPAVYDESPEGHALQFDVNGDLCGITVIGVSHHIDDSGHVALTVPKREELGLDDLVLA